MTGHSWRGSNLPRTKLDDIIAPVPSTSHPFFPINTHVPLAHVRVAPLPSSPSLLLVPRLPFVVPIFLLLSRETHTSGDLVSVRFDKVEFIFEQVILVRFGRDVVVQPICQRH